MSEKKKEEKDEKASTTSAPSAGLQGMKVLATQVGGHMYGQNGSKIGMLDRGNGLVLKGLQNPPRGTRELFLYQTTFAPACSNQDLLELRHFLPTYHGKEVIDDVTFLILQNITESFTKPNILDVKMGQVTYDPEASEEKKQHELAKYPPMRQLGFMLTGMMTHDGSSGRSIRVSKQYCRSLTAENMLTEGLGKFFGLQNGCLRRDVVQALLSKLRRIESWFQVQRTFAFYASSLLIVYSSEDHSPPASCQDSYRTPAHHVSATTDVNGSKNQDPVSDSTVPCPSPSPHQIAGRPSENSEKNKVVGTASICVEDGAQRQSESAISGTSNKLQSGQKRGHEEDEESDAQSSRQRKMPRGISGDGGVSGSKRENVLACDKTPTDKAFLRTCGNDNPLVEVRMIDFAHVFPASDKDTNYLFGLQKLISLLEQLLEM